MNVRLILPLLSVWLFAGSRMIPSYEGDLQTYSVHAGISNISVEIYEDPDGKKQLKEDGEAVSGITDEDGQLSFDLSEGDYYFSYTHALPGYYQDSRIHPLKKETYIAPDPVEIELQMNTLQPEHDAKLQILDVKGKVIADDADASASSLLLAGHTYTVHEVQEDPWIAVKDEILEIPEEKPDALPTAVIQERLIGKAAVECLDQDQSPAGGISWQFYTDEACKQKAKDAFGQNAVMKTDSEGKTEICLEPGVYWLKETDLPEEYYRSEKAEKILITERDRRNIKEEVHQISMSCRLQNAEDGSDIQATAELRSEGEENRLISLPMENETVLKRGRKYVLHILNTPGGYFDADDISFRTPEEESRPLSFVISMIPYHVSLVFKNEKNGMAVAGVLAEVKDEEGNPIASMYSRTEPVTLNGLKAGGHYRLSIRSLPAGYLAGDPVSFEIPECAEDDQIVSIAVRSQLVPYGKLQLRVRGSDDENIAGVYDLYRDEACRKAAVDIEGHVCQSLAFSDCLKLLNGSYYAKVTDIDPHYCMHDEAIPVQVDTDTDFTKTVSLKAVHADTEIACLSADGTVMKNVTFGVYDADAHQLSTFVLSDSAKLSDYVDHSLLQKDVPLYLHIEKVPGSFVYESRYTKTLPSADDQEAISFLLTPYTELTIHESNEGNPVSGSLYQLYTDAACTEEARTIHGAEAAGRTDEKGNLSLAMRDGIYYLKQQESDSFYADPEIHTIDLSDHSGKKHLDLSSAAPSLLIRLVDERSKEIQGGLYQVTDENGIPVAEFSSSTEVKGNGVRPGMTLTIHEKQSVEGYEACPDDLIVTLPENRPDTIPSYDIVHTGIVEKNILPILPDTAEHTHPNPLPLLALLLCIAGGLTVMKILSKKNVKKYHLH